MIKAIGYIRVSTEQQVSEGISLENQKDQIEKYCKYKGFELVDVITDAGISGGINKARPGFISLLDRIEAGEAEAVVLYSLERLSRDMLTLLALERLLDEYGIDLHTVEGQVDTSEPDGFMSFAMRAFMGEMERRQVKHRTRKAMQFKKSQGQVVGSIPYGYKRAGDRLEPEAIEAGTVGIAQGLYARGKGLTEIARELKEQGIKTRSGKDFAPVQVKALLPDYQKVYATTRTRLSQDIRQFVTAIC
jgi:site-specific DNA recombinase